MVNPPILSDVTESDKEKQQYSEYFMPVNEYKPQLGEYKKTKKGASAAKIFCWTFSLFLLAGAIVLAVLIGSKSLFTRPGLGPQWDQSSVFLTNNKHKSKPKPYSRDHRHGPRQNGQSQPKAAARDRSPRQPRHRQPHRGQGDGSAERPHQPARVLYLKTK